MEMETETQRLGNEYYLINPDKYSKARMRLKKELRAEKEFHVNLIKDIYDKYSGYDPEETTEGRLELDSDSPIGMKIMKEVIKFDRSEKVYLP
mmetsp:Transcript_24862/g.22065  ORF Transcript_24862/g.22065 Transcript_24862/m.22065 type:complete len:93 (-) Transcript_24862:620-898(-)